MHYLFKIDDKGLSTQVELPALNVSSSGGYRILVVDPLTWSFIATLFVTEFTKSFAQELGKGVASALLRGLGLVQDDTKTFRAYLEQLALRIAREIRDALNEDALREQHGNLDAAFKDFQEFLNSPSTRLNDLSRIDGRVGEIYAQLKTLGLRALPALVAAASLRIGAKAARFHLQRTKGEAENLQLAMTEIMETLDAKVNEMGRVFEKRVAGPYEIREVAIRCRQAPGHDGPGPGEFEERYVPGVGCLIDGRTTERPVRDCDSRNTNARAVVDELCDTARRTFKQDFQRLYQDPLTALKADVERLSAEVAKRVKR